jgi:hypothetical protein
MATSKQTPRTQRRLRKAIGAKTPKWTLGSGSWSIPSPYRGLNAAARNNQTYAKGMFSTRVKVSTAESTQDSSGRRGIEVDPIKL